MKTISIYPTSEIEIKNEVGNKTHFDVLTPGDWTSAEQHGVTEKAQEVWTPQAISDYEAYIASLVVIAVE